MKEPFAMFAEVGPEERPAKANTGWPGRVMSTLCQQE